MDRPIDASTTPPAPVPARAARTVDMHRLTILIVAAMMLLAGVALRAPTANYDGPADQWAFNDYIFQFVGAYSDISSLYFRDQLWTNPAPYFDYRVEYPVGMALIIWLMTVLSTSVTSYLYLTAAVMAISGLLIVWLGFRFEGSNMWLLALSPTLPLYVVLNWDMAGILLLVGALLLFRRDRDRWGAFALAAAVWTKFFPVVLVPLILLDRVLRRRWRDAFEIGGIFGVASVLFNAPFALQWTDQGIQIRDTWLFFFRFNRERNREVNLWNIFERYGYELTTEQINTYSTVLLVIGIGVISAVMLYASLRGVSRTRDILLPASLAAIGWFLFINKVYSPQYSLWLAVLLALLAAPPTVAAIFAGADVAYFASAFIMLYLMVNSNPAVGWFYDQALYPSMVLRELIILGIIGWALWRMARRDPKLDTASISVYEEKIPL
jgi:hypothetical protein